MTDYELLKACERIKKCELKKGAWDTELKGLRAALSDEMSKRGAESYSIGRYSIRKTIYTREQVDTQKLKQERPEVYALYSRTNRVTTLTVNV